MEKEDDKLTLTEYEMLIGKFQSSGCSDASTLVSKYREGLFVEIIENEKFKTLFECCQVTDSEDNTIASILEGHLTGCMGTSITKFEVFLLGIASLQEFVMANWTAASNKKSIDSCLTPWLLHALSPEFIGSRTIAQVLRDSLSIDGEDICPAIYFPELLLVSKVCLTVTQHAFPSVKWWLMRCIYIHQQILDEHSCTLQAQLMDLSNTIKSLPLIEQYKDLKLLLHLEVARIYLHYGQVMLSDGEISAALKMSNMEVNLVGALGKRTQYQTREIAQLTLQFKVDESKRMPQDKDSIEFPKDVTLDDDVRLPKVAFSNPKDCDYPDLTCFEHAILIAMFVQKKKSQAKDRLLKEELMPYLSCLLSQPKVWSIQLAVLLFRSRLESDHRRTIERSLLQTQALMSFENNGTPPLQRLHLFYCSYAPPHFVIGADCASILVSLGSIQSALDIYLKLELWEDVIACYNRLKLRHKAAEVIREQMKKGETVKLLCYLGDATDDLLCYEKAWELSKHKSAQAQRHWGMYYFNRQEYKECIPHLKQSLKINSLQVSMWFRLGYAALMEHDWEESASAYRRYCSLEPDSFEAWNNLAKAYILLGQKHRAYNALHEAIKCNYETWQVWDNLMAVSSDCGDFEGVINCYHRILDLKEKHIDEQILSVLTAVVIKGIKDSKGNPASTYKKKALELFGRITSKVMNNPTVWQLYARLTASLEDQSSITKSKTAQYLQKAHTASIQDYNWCKDFESIKNVVKLCQSLADAYFVCSKQCSSPKEQLQLLTSAQMSLRSILTKIQQEHLDVSTGNIHKEVENDYRQLQSTYETIQTDIQQIRNTLNA